MVEIERLRALISRLVGRCEELAPYSRLALDEYLATPEKVHASKYLLLTAIEDALAITNHVIASEGLRAPSDYADAFRSLEEGGLLPQALSLRLESMARFRNPIVHVYAQVDDRRVHAILRDDLADLRELARIVLERFRRANAGTSLRNAVAW
jgi:uncharacterized protein YutE (UPF0331/DUF86 family)